jgi:hypothetical protein
MKETKSGKSRAPKVNADKKRRHLNYLIQLIQDWEKDCLSLNAVVSRITARARRVNREAVLPPDLPNDPETPTVPAGAEDHEWCAACLCTIQRNTHWVAQVVKRDYSENDAPLWDSLNEPSALELSNTWMRLVLGLFKQIVIVYGSGSIKWGAQPPPNYSVPGPIPDESDSDPDDDEPTLWSKLRTVLEHFAQESVDFVHYNYGDHGCGFPVEDRAASSSGEAECLQSIEQLTHQLLGDYGRIADDSPYHFNPRLGALTKGYGTGRGG